MRCMPAHRSNRFACLAFTAGASFLAFTYLKRPPVFARLHKNVTFGTIGSVLAIRVVGRYLSLKSQPGGIDFSRPLPEIIGSLTPQNFAHFEAAHNWSAETPPPQGITFAHMEQMQQQGIGLSYVKQWIMPMLERQGAEIAASAPLMAIVKTLDQKTQRVFLQRHLEALDHYADEEIPRGGLPDFTRLYDTAHWDYRSTSGWPAQRIDRFINLTKWPINFEMCSAVQDLVNFYISFPEHAHAKAWIKTNCNEYPDLLAECCYEGEQLKSNEQIEWLISLADLDIDKGKMATCIWHIYMSISHDSDSVQRLSGLCKRLPRELQEAVQTQVPNLFKQPEG